MDRGAQVAIVHEVTESDRTEQARCCWKEQAFIISGSAALIQHILNDSLLSIPLPGYGEGSVPVFSRQQRNKTIFESFTAMKVVQQKDWFLLGSPCPAHPLIFI